MPVQSEEANGKARQGSGKAGKGRRGCYSPARLHNAVAKVAPHLKVWFRRVRRICLCVDCCLTLVLGTGFRRRMMSWQLESAAVQAAHIATARWKL